MGLMRLAVLPLLCVISSTVDAQTPPSSELASGQTRVTIAKGKLLEFKGSNTALEITKAAGPEALFTVVKDAAAADIRVQMVTHDKGVTICAVYPSKDPKKPNECLPGAKGRLSQGNPKDLPTLRLKIEVPAGVDISASTMFGDLRSTGAPGNLSLYSGRGNLAVVDGGTGDIQAGVGLLGNIDALIVQSAAGVAARRARFEAAGSGQIRVGMPTNMPFRYVISSQSALTIDPAFRFEKTTGPLLTGSHGGGAGEVSLSVDTGIAGRFILRRTN